LRDRRFARGIVLALDSRPSRPSSQPAYAAAPWTAS